MSLAALVRDRAQRAPDDVAVVGPAGTLRYGPLDRLADRAANALRELGVGPGDRVAIWCEKSPQAIAVMQGALRIGAAYVPLDPLSPLLRARRIIRESGARCLFTSELARAGAALEDDDVAVLTATPREHASADVERGRWMAWDELERMPDTPPLLAPGGDRLAYILYTSGSTGAPKGVCLSHNNALAFVDGMLERLHLSPADRLANHAPFHFDLSVFDLYAAFRSGARTLLIPERAAYAPRRLVELAQAEKISVWYSVPSVLTLMLDRGGLAEDAERLALRIVLFAGEVFPPPALARLRRALPRARLLNLYGPTETNVCTLHEVDTDYDGARPLPIGSACCGARVWARGEDGVELPPGALGELVVEGPTVMLGYFGEPPQTPHYATGDLVRARDDGAFEFVGRRDQMVKVRGNRVDLGEIEAVLVTHPDIVEAIALVCGHGLDARLVAVMTTRDGRRPRLLSIKEHCADHLPPYMVVHTILVVEALPRTSTGKVDRRRIQTMVEGAGDSDRGRDGDGENGAK